LEQPAVWITPPERGDIRYARRHPSGPVVVYEHAGRWWLAEGGHAIDVADDPALPGLRAALDAGAAIVRYHPHLRCTVRLGDRFGKVLADDSGRALLAAQAELWAHREKLGFAVAEPLEYDAATRTVWLGRVRGEPVEPTPALARRMGAALATLARSGVVPPGGEARGGEAAAGGARRGEGAPARRSPRAVGDALVAAVPALRGEVDALLARIAALHAAARDMPLRPVHGAPHPTAWLVDGERLGLVDFDRLALGHPERDVAALQAAAPALAEAFADGFGALDAGRLEAYRLERGLAKALRATYDLSEDAHERAVRRLRKAAAPP
jgi:hypothetical protein